MEMHQIPCGRFIDPFTDFGFKRIFGTDANKDILIDFLNVLFEGERQVRDLTFNQNENNAQLSRFRKAIFDLCCTGADGEQFIVEVQRVRQEYFRDRCLYYAASLIRDQVGAGAAHWKYDLKPVYLVGLMDFCFEDSDNDHYLHEIRLIKKSDGRVFYNNFGLTFIEMPGFNKTEAELVTELDRWLYLFKNLSKLNDIPIGLTKPVFEKVFRVAEVCNLTKEEKMAWDAYLKAKWDNENSDAYAREQAIKEGMKEGKVEGIKEGKLSIARNMKAKGFDIETISEVTGLTPAEILTA
ncbi:conserved hypothetical protein (putative transposase or invertase) [Dyadobacter soli]|uniref:Rpn family recombination-promoting nuclease/putative transposase n=2 Tax=Dyadobacter soli TaxID=659014 RepID=A0A1G7NXG8_9BACT|nr:conserved hypothetical protein (putative transposase or invertase) [Dyadobacter soli]